MAKVTIQAKKREEEKSKNLVFQGLLPAVIYDQKGNSDKIVIDDSKIRNILATITPTSIIELVIDGAKPKLSLVKEVQKHPRTNVLTHLSFMELDQDKESIFPVEIQLTGESPAVRNSLGLLLAPKDVIELKGYPRDIPEFLTLDISGLVNVGDSLTVANLKIPAGLSFVHEDDPRMVVATIRPFQKEEEEKKPVVAAEGEEAVEGAAEGETPAEAGTEAPKEEK